jgi:hypothetical protein
MVIPSIDFASILENVVTFSLSSLVIGALSMVLVFIIVWAFSGIKAKL